MEIGHHLLLYPQPSKTRQWRGQATFFLFFFPFLFSGKIERGGRLLPFVSLGRDFFFPPLLKKGAPHVFFFSAGDPARPFLFSPFSRPKKIQLVLPQVIPGGKVP